MKVSKILRQKPNMPLSPHNIEDPLQFTRFFQFSNLIHLLTNPLFHILKTFLTLLLNKPPEIKPLNIGAQKLCQGKELQWI